MDGLKSIDLIPPSKRGLKYNESFCLINKRNSDERSNRKTGDAWFQKWLDEESDWSSGWCAWADCYWLWKSYPVETDYEKAKMLYQKGLFSGNAEDRAFILERMKHLAQDQKMNNEALPDD